MSPGEYDAFIRAVLEERNPNHLFGFTAALAPDHCVAASLLHARGVLLDTRGSLDRALCDALLDAVVMMPFYTGAIDDSLLHGRGGIDAMCVARGASPLPLYRLVRRCAGELVVDANAQFPEVPTPVVYLARGLVLTLGPVRVLDPHAVRTLLPPTTMLATPQEQVERDRWVRHYCLRPERE